MQNVYLVVKEVNACIVRNSSTIIAGVYATMKDANNKVIDPFNPSSLEEFDEAHHAVTKDGSFGGRLNEFVQPSALFFLLKSLLT